MGNAVLSKSEGVWLVHADGKLIGEVWANGNSFEAWSVRAGIACDLIGHYATTENAMKAIEDAAIEDAAVEEAEAEAEPEFDCET